MNGTEGKMQPNNIYVANISRKKITQIKKHQ